MQACLTTTKNSGRPERVLSRERKLLFNHFLTSEIGPHSYLASDRIRPALVLVKQ